MFCASLNQYIKNYCTYFFFNEFDCWPIPSTEISYFKIAPKANLNSDAYLITMKIRKPMQAVLG